MGRARALHLTRAVGIPETRAPVTAPPSARRPSALRGDAPGSPRPAGPRRRADPREDPGSAPHPLADPSPPPGPGRASVQPRGAGVTLENFPRRGCAGDFRRPPRGRRAGAVLEGHLGLSRDRGSGFRGAASLHFPSRPAHPEACRVPGPPLLLGFEMGGWLCVGGGFRGAGDSPSRGLASRPLPQSLVCVGGGARAVGASQDVG